MAMSVPDIKHLSATINKELLQSSIRMRVMMTADPHLPRYHVTVSGQM